MSKGITIRQSQSAEILTSCFHHISVVIHTAGITLQNVFTDHVGTIVTQENMIGNHIRTELQLHHGIFLVGHNGGTVTTTVNRTVNDGGLVLLTRQADRHLLSIGTEGIQSIY